MHRHRTLYTVMAIAFVVVIMLGLSAYKQQEMAKTIPYHAASKAASRDPHGPAANSSVRMPPSQASSIEETGVNSVNMQVTIFPTPSVGVTSETIDVEVSPPQQSGSIQPPKSSLR